MGAVGGLLMALSGGWLTHKPPTRQLSHPPHQAGCPLKIKVAALLQMASVTCLISTWVKEEVPEKGGLGSVCKQNSVCRSLQRESVEMWFLYREQENIIWSNLA